MFWITQSSTGSCRPPPLLPQPTHPLIHTNQGRIATNAIPAATSSGSCFCKMPRTQHQPRLLAPPQQYSDAGMARPRDIRLNPAHDQSFRTGILLVLTRNAVRRWAVSTSSVQALPACDPDAHNHKVCTELRMISVCISDPRCFALAGRTTQQNLCCNTLLPFEIFAVEGTADPCQSHGQCLQDFFLRPHLSEMAQPCTQSTQRSLNLSADHKLALPPLKTTALVLNYLDTLF